MKISVALAVEVMQNEQPCYSIKYEQGIRWAKPFEDKDLTATGSFYLTKEGLFYLTHIPYFSDVLSPEKTEWKYVADLKMLGVGEMTEEELTVGESYFVMIIIDDLMTRAVLLLESETEKEYSFVYREKNKPDRLFTVEKDARGVYFLVFGKIRKLF